MSYENEMKQAFRQLGPLGEREACEIAATADAEIAALKQRVAELERELEAARKVCATATCINQGYKNGVYEIAARDKPEHELAEAFFASLDSELAAALEKEQSNAKG